MGITTCCNVQEVEGLELLPIVSNPYGDYHLLQPKIDLTHCRYIVAFQTPMGITTCCNLISCQIKGNSCKGFKPLWGLPPVATHGITKGWFSWPDVSNPYGDYHLLQHRRPSSRSNLPLWVSNPYGDYHLLQRLVWSGRFEQTSCFKPLWGLPPVATSSITRCIEACRQVSNPYGDYHLLQLKWSSSWKMGCSMFQTPMGITTCCNLN